LIHIVAKLTQITAPIAFFTVDFARDGPDLFSPFFRRGDERAFVDAASGDTLEAGPGPRRGKLRQEPWADQAAHEHS
jgi:hypothetical protein